MDTSYYEGCGRQGPIRCIFLSVFHPVEGPKVTCQCPEDYLTKDKFDAITSFIIPKPTFHNGTTMTINAFGHKFIGYTARVDNPRYARNAFIFNICFVCDNWSKTVQYEHIVEKFGHHLQRMESESLFVSNGVAKMPFLLSNLLHDLNMYGKATIMEGEFVMHLKVLDVPKDPPPVEDIDVPVLLASIGHPRPGSPVNMGASTNQCPTQPPTDKQTDARNVQTTEDWDLTSKQILPLIDGYTHVSKISLISNVDKALVKACIQHLIYYGVVAIVPILKFSNMYRATPKLRRIFSDSDLQRACMRFVCEGTEEKGRPTFKQVVDIICALKQGTTLRTVTDKFMIDRGLNFDIRRVIIFALLHQLIICLKKYPVVRNASSPQGLQVLFNGDNCTDTICHVAQVDQATLNKEIDEDPNITTIWR